MEPRELSIDEFNALYYLSEQTNPIGIVSINTVSVLWPQLLKSLKNIVLTSNAVAYVRNVSEDSSKPEAITLVKIINSNLFQITEEGRDYVNYYNEYVLNK